MTQNSFCKNFSRILIALFLPLFLFLSTPSLASEGEAHKNEKFNAGEMIMGHVTDAHSWHVADLGGHALSIPLPIIIYHEGKGLNVFMSSKFDHGHSTYKGYGLIDGKIRVVDEHGEVNETESAMLWDFSITKNVAAIFFTILLMIWIFSAVAKAYQRRGQQAPKGLQSLLEPIIIFVRDDIAKAAIGEKKYEKFLPFLLTIFFFIWISNMLGLIPLPPGGANVTGAIAVPMVMAILVFIITTLNGNKHYWRHTLAMPGVPWPILIILTPIEIMGMFLRPFVLMIRLFANITAGHIIVLSFFSLIFIFGESSTGVGLGTSVFSVAFSLFMTMLELLVAFIQAYVFTLLSAMYFGSAIEEAH